MNNYKILHIINRLSEASFLFDWANILHRRGWDIAVLPIEPRLNQVRAEEFGVPIIKIPKYRRGDPRVIREIRHKISQYNIRLIHVHQNYSGGMASLAVFNNKNVYVVNTEHGIHEGFKKIGLLMNTASLLRGDYHCFNSNYTLNSLKCWEKYLIRKKPKNVIYNGVPIIKIEKNKKFKESVYHKFGLTKDKFYIGKIATFKKQKDHITLLKAIKILVKKHPEVRLLLIGDGSLHEELKDEVTLINSIGVDSTEMVESVIALEKAFGVKLSPKEITKNSTINDIVSNIEAKLKGTS